MWLASCGIYFGKHYYINKTKLVFMGCTKICIRWGSCLLTGAEYTYDIGWEKIEQNGGIGLSGQLFLNKGSYVTNTRPQLSMPC